MRSNLNYKYLPEGIGPGGIGGTGGIGPLQSIGALEPSTKQKILNSSL